MADFALGFWRKALVERSTHPGAGGAGRPWRRGFPLSLWPLCILLRSGHGQALTATSAASPDSSAYNWPACSPVSGVQHTRPPMPQRCQKPPVYRHQRKACTIKSHLVNICDGMLTLGACGKGLDLDGVGGRREARSGQPGKQPGWPVALATEGKGLPL